jgi:hypothetical protein
MTSEQVLTIILAVMVNIPIWLGMRWNMRKTSGDAYGTLVEALNKSGKTIGELFDELGEVPQLRKELADVKADWRLDNQGAWVNHDQLVENQIPPRYKPRKRYETGPLAEKKT